MEEVLERMASRSRSSAGNQAGDNRPPQAETERYSWLGGMMGLGMLAQVGPALDPPFIFKGGKPQLAGHELTFAAIAVGNWREREEARDRATGLEFVDTTEGWEKYWPHPKPFGEHLDAATRQPVNLEKWFQLLEQEFLSRKLATKYWLEVLQRQAGVLHDRVSSQKIAIEQKAADNISPWVLYEAVRASVFL